MKRVYAILPYVMVAFFGTLGFFISCKPNSSENQKDTILRGKATLWVDESLLPIVEDQQLVFQTTYEASLTLEPSSEVSVIKKLSEAKSGIAILSRKLNANETQFLKAQRIVPRTTPFALDGVALIGNVKTLDTVVNLETLLGFLQGKNKALKGLVFDNPNSGTVRYMMEKAGITQLPSEGVYSQNNTQAVIQYVAEHEGMVGLVGSNWLFQPNATLQPWVEKVKILGVQQVNGSIAYPTQEALGTNDYPLARVLYIINCQGYEGLGIGFASFIAGDKGQRIVLKSGIAPIREPGRKIVTRKQIEKTKI